MNMVALHAHLRPAPDPKLGGGIIAKGTANTLFQLIILHVRCADLDVVDHTPDTAGGAGNARGAMSCQKAVHPTLQFHDAVLAGDINQM